MNREIASFWLCMHSRLGLVNAHWFLIKRVSFDFNITLSCSVQNYYQQKMDLQKLLRLDTQMIK